MASVSAKMKMNPSRYVFAFIFLLLASWTLFAEILATELNNTIPVNVGVVLDFDDLAGNISLSEFYATRSHYKPRLLLHIRDSKKDDVGAGAAEAVRGDNPASRLSLAPIIGLGDSFSVPRSWEIRTNGKKLQIGVPIKEGFTEFVHLARNPSTDAIMPSRFCIDVFAATVKELPFAVTYESMITPIEEHKKRNSWVFLKPLTFGIWLTTICIFIVIGFVVWVLLKSSLICGQLDACGDT